MSDNQEYGYAGKTAIITGAAGEIGAVIAEAFASNGCSLILVDLEDRTDTLNQQIQVFQQTYGVHVEAYVVDIRNKQSVDRFSSWLMDAKRTCDVLVNNAGINKLIPALSVSEADWDEIIDTNLKGTFLMSQCVAKKMMQQNSGVIVNISSQHGEVGNEKRAPYCASKAGINNMTRALAVEWAKYNIRLNCIAPTYVLHDKNRALLANPATAQKLLKDIPMGRFCSPEDIANAVIYMASDLAKFITGQILVVDGGYTAR